MSRNVLEVSTMCYKALHWARKVRKSIGGIKASLELSRTFDIPLVQLRVV